jgi:putative oxygen-independent coproporphyrinogen III oxidase
VPSSLPDGDPAPADGSLPPMSLRSVGARGFGVYVHVPFCTTRCGYCDFNTYTATELAGGARREDYAATVISEIRLAARVVDGAAPAVDTIFFGGGTPTLLGSDDLARIVDAVESAFGVAPGVEITTEANPETVDPQSLGRLRRAGFTRISLGMQSAVPHVLAALDRRHTPGRPQEAVAEAREAGFDHVNLDLIYGAPGESMTDWQASLDAVVGAGVDHVSAYALIVEEGTQLHRKVSRGEVLPVDDDGLADRYLRVEEVLSAAGFGWYEVSNWASTVDGRCRHNELYWASGDWWGFGPGAHSHIGGTRWWNVKHPAAYASRLAEGNSPAHSREILSTEDRRVEDVLLRLRMVEGVPLDVLTTAGRVAAERACVDGLLERDGDRVVLTLRGRLLADAVVRDLVD